MAEGDFTRTERSRLFDKVEAAQRQIDRADEQIKQLARGIEAFEKHVEACAEESKLTNEALHKIQLGIQNLHNDNKQFMDGAERRDTELEVLKVQAAESRRDLVELKKTVDSIVEWRKFFIRRILWWAIPIVLTMFAGMLTGHFDAIMSK